MNFPRPADAPPAFNVPAPVFWLIAGLALAHVLRIALPEENSLYLLLKYALIPARYSQDWLTANNVDPGSFWDQSIPFITYMGLHGDFTHLAINLLWLLAFGPVVARRFRAVRFFVFFLVCGLAGAAFHLATNWGSPAPVVGASAAISGLMAAGIRMMPLRGPFDQAPANDVALAPLWSRQMLLFSAIWIAVNLVTGITGLGAGGEIRLIAWEAHLGGYLAGYFLAGPFDRWPPAPRYA